MDAPDGVWERIEETERGLECSGRLTMGVKRAQELRDLMVDGAVGGLSIGFRSLRDRLDPSGVRVLEEIELMEISLVALPANPLAVVEAVKGLHETPKTEREFERALREHLGFSARAARSSAAGGFKGEVRDEYADQKTEARDAPGLDLSGFRDALANAKSAL